jgi:tripartite-type tricarboxylate transporter receptor subunit TctC
MINRAIVLLRLAATFLVAASVTTAHAQWSPSRPVRLIVPFPQGGLDASSEQGSLWDANVRESAAAAVLIAQAPAPSTWSPNRPVRLIVPFPPGGAVDVIGRIVASRLSERLGQQVVVDNRGGANAIIGTDLAAKAAPDGHTILIEPAGHAMTPSVMRKLPYDTLADLAAIGLIGNGAYVLVVNPALPAKSVAEFIAYAKTRPGQINYAYTGYGNATHLAGELFKVLTGTDMVGIVYKGGGPALTDLLGGQIPVFFPGVASSAAHIKAGKLRALGVTTTRRAGALPDVPTIAEAGVPGFEVDGWYGLLAPRATPAAAIQRFNSELAALLALPDMQERLLAAGIDARASTPAEFHDRIARDITRWAEVVKKARIAIE